MSRKLLIITLVGFFSSFISCDGNENQSTKCCTELDKSILLKGLSADENAYNYLINQSANRLTKSFKEDSLVIESYRFNEAGKITHYNFYNYNGDKNSIIGVNWDENKCANVLGGNAMKLVELHRSNSDTLDYIVYAPQIIGYQTELLLYEKVNQSVDTTILSELRSPGTALLLPKSDFKQGTDSIYIETKISSLCGDQILAKAIYGMKFNIPL